jgi:hypothetical protein
MSSVSTVNALSFTAWRGTESIGQGLGRHGTALTLLFSFHTPVGLEFFPISVQLAGAGSFGSIAKLDSTFLSATETQGRMCEMH